MKTNKQLAKDIFQDIADIIPFGLLISHGWDNNKWVKLEEKYLK